MQRVVRVIGEATPTTTGVDDGVDVSFVATVAGLTIEGEVTLIPGDYDPRHYSSWGAPDNWVDGRALAALRDLSPDDYREVLSEIEAATSAAAGRVVQS